MAGVVGLREVRYGYDGANHLQAIKKDESNPYFTYDPAKCIVCNPLRARLRGDAGHVRADDRRAAASNRAWRRARTSRSWNPSACRAAPASQACPTAHAAWRNRDHRSARPSTASITTCAYCGVGCSFKAEMKGNEVVRMVPNKDGQANHGHACVKGRFAWGYATHKDRITKPMIRAKITDPWREVSWDEAIDYAAREFKRIQAKYGRDSIGGITSSRCTNEETYLVQKLVRAAFGNNNVDTCARVCHSPTGYGLKTDARRIGRHAGRSIRSMKADVIMVIGANPTDGHPVFASQMKRRAAPGREADRRRSAPHRHRATRRTSRRDYHLQLRPGTNVAMVNALAHVIVTEGLIDEAVRRRALRATRVRASGSEFVAEPAQLARSDGGDHRRAGRSTCAPPRASTRRGGNGAIYYGLGVTEHSQGSTDGDGHREPRDGDRQPRPRRRRRESAARPEQRAGLVRHGLVPARAAGLPPRVATTPVRALFEKAWGVHAADRAGPAHPEHVRSRARRQLQGPVHPGRGHRAVRSEHAARDRGAVGDGMRRRAGHLPERDREVRARVPAGLVVPREGRHVHQRRAPHLARAQGHGAAARATPTGKSRCCCRTRSAIR